MDLTNYNLNVFCTGAGIDLEALDADGWLALDRETRADLVFCWWLDNDDKGYSAGKGAEKCAEFFASKTNSIRGLQNETFKDQLAPWQAGYKSDWRENAADLAAMEAVKDEPSMPWDEFEKTLPAPVDYADLETRAVGHMLASPHTEEQQAALKFLDEAGLTVEDAKHAVGAVTQLAAQTGIPAMQQLVDAAADHIKARKARGQNEKTPWVFEDGTFKAKVPGQAICVCPSCGMTAHDHTAVLAEFSIRYDDEAKTKPRPQSLCKTCRKIHAKARRALKQQLDLPSA